MNKTKRSIGLAVILSIALISQGCSATQWLNVAAKDLPVVLQIVVNILQISDVAAIPQAKSAAAAATTDIATLQKLVADYKAAVDPTAKNKVLADVQAALTAANTDISAILAAVHIADPKKQAAIAAAVGVALSTLIAIESLLPTAAPTPAVAAVKLHGPPTPSEVKKAYNAAVSGAYPSAVIH